MNKTECMTEDEDVVVVLASDIREQVQRLWDDALLIGFGTGALFCAVIIAVFIWIV